MAETGNRDDPFSAFNYIVELEGVDVAAFSECSGISNETDVIEYRNGTEVNTVRKLPGLKKFSNLVLKRGLTTSTELWEWRKTVMDGQTERKSGSVVLLNENREEAMRWNFLQAWPSKWEGPSFNAKNSEVAIETLELALESLELAT